MILVETEPIMKIRRDFGVKENMTLNEMKSVMRIQLGIGSKGNMISKGI